MADREWKHGDVAQINPDKNEMFGGCYLVVTEVKSWGIMGFAMIPETGGATRAYVRMAYDDIAYVGESVWMPFDETPAAGTA